MVLAYPNSELVAQAWVAKYTTIPAAQIAGSLAAVEKWTNNAFLTIRALPAGNPHPELPQARGSVLQVDGWAGKPSSTKPLWGAALQLLERIRVATFRDAQAYGKSLEMPVAGYLAARVQSVYLITEPTRVEGDPSSFARVTADLAVDWTV